MELKNKTVLISGGAGVIGSHLAKKLIEEYQCEVIVIDDLSSGHDCLGDLKEDVYFYHTSILNDDVVEKIFINNQIKSTSTSFKFKTDYSSAGVYPITSSVGALETTTMGTIVRGSPMDGDGYQSIFIKEVLKTLENREELPKLREEVQRVALERFNPKRILGEWERLVFN